MPPVLVPAITILAGATAGTLLDIPSRPALAGLPLVAAVAVAAWCGHRARLTLASVSTGFCLAAVVLAADAREHALHSSVRSALDRVIGGFAIETLGPEHDHDPVLTRAVLLEDAVVRDDYVSLRIEVVAVRLGSSWHAAAGGVTLSVSGEAGANRARDWRAGRVIEAPVTFRRAARYLNDGVPDFERQRALDGTTLLGSVKSALLVDVVARASAFEEWTGRVRERVRRAIDQWVIDDEASASIVIAVLIGDRGGLSQEVIDRLQRAGTYHVIAISGGNIAMLAAATVVALALIGIHGRVAAATTIVVLVVYSQIAAAGPSVWRATLMAILYLAARVLDHRTAPWQATLVAASAMAIVVPLDVRAAGFILTFGATAALLESARWFASIRSSLGRRGPWRGRKTLSTALHGAVWIGASIAASIAVELVLSPVSAQMFSRVTLAGPLLNLVAVPAMAVAQISGLIVVFFAAWPLVASPAGWTAGHSASLIVGTARLVDIMPWLSWRVPPPGLLLLAIYYGSLVILLSVPRLRIRVTAGLCVMAGWLLIVHALHIDRAEAVGGVRLTMFDVGQGEALLLESGRQRLQIDAGGAPFGAALDIGIRVVAPALWARRVASVDALLLTHGDPDHIGGAPVFFDAFHASRLWEGVVVPRHEPSRMLREMAVTSGARVEARRAGDTMTWGHTRVRVLHPPEPDWERPRVRNDDSVVLEVTCGDVAMLLTGDISAGVERAISPQLTPASIRILKVAHHGSRTSSSTVLLETWRPQVALISAGRGNSFGHPTREVLDRLEAIGARVYRTDRDGEITVDSDCRTVGVRTFNDKKP